MEAAAHIPRGIRVLIADDHRLFSEALEAVLSADGRVEVVAHAADGAEAVKLALELEPDVVLMDISMPVMDGVDATRSIHAALPSIHVIGLSGFEKTPDLHPIELAGAVAYFQKDADMRHLIERVLGLRDSSIVRQAAESG